MISFDNIKTDCRHLRGDIPCKPHKNYNVHCTEPDGTDCEYYDKIDKKILIIKLGAIGDVIRTTPLFTRIKQENPNAKIYWLTLTPAVVPSNVDVTLKLDEKSIIYLKSVEFDVIFNLDKDKEACALINQLSAPVKKGYVLKYGLPYPADEDAYHKYMTGLFDDVNQANTKNYLEEIFEICGYDFKGEKYILDTFDEYEDDWNEIDKSKKVIGLNTGCGGRWTSRLWDEANWVTLAKNLLNNGCEVILLGGKQEDEKNKRLAEQSGGKYLGHFSLEKFINEVNQCDLVVTGVTMAMHITLALNKKMVLFNNIFNKHEFELYGLGEILEPSKKCTCFFRPTCVNPEYNCMEYLEPDRVFNTITKILS